MRKIVFTDNGALLEGLRSGKEEVFRYLFDKYYSAISRNIRKLVADECAAEDLLQECFITLWEKRNDLADAVDLGGWLFNTSYYKSMSYLRSNIKRAIVNQAYFPEDTGIEDGEQQIEASHIYQQRMALLNNAIAALPQQRQRAVILCKVQGEPYEKVAQEMNLSEATIRQYVKLSMAALRGSLNGE